MIRQCLKNIARDEAGSFVIEYAILLPTFLLLLIGSFDLGHTVYIQSVLKGAVNEASRASSLETAGGKLNDIDEEVRSRVNMVMPGADIQFQRKSYFDFTDLKRPESFEDKADKNGQKNGRYDKGECFSDENGNGVRDTDVGRDGLGGPTDIVRYTVSVEYKTLFPLQGLIGVDNHRTATVQTVLRNQPFAEEAKPNITRICS